MTILLYTKINKHGNALTRTSRKRNYSPLPGQKTPRTFPGQKAPRTRRRKERKGKSFAHRFSQI